MEPDLLARGPAVISGLELVQWGRVLALHGHFTENNPAGFRLIFEDCRELRWQLYAHTEAAGSAFPPAELVDFRAGRGGHRLPARLLTAHFGLTVLYGTLRLET